MSMSTLPLRNHECHSLTCWDFSFVSHNFLKTPGKIFPKTHWDELLSCACTGLMQTDLACSPSMAATHKPNMAGRQEKKNSPLCLVNPKCPIGLKWFQLVVLGLRLWAEVFQLPRHLIALFSLWNEVMQMPPAIQTLHHYGPSITSTQHVNETITFLLLITA